MLLAIRIISVSSSRKCARYFALAALAWASVCPAQQKYSIDADANPAIGSSRITGSSGTVSGGGVIDGGPPPPPEKAVLLTRAVRVPGGMPDAHGKLNFSYSVQMKNAGTHPIDVPVGTMEAKVITGCSGSAIYGSGLALFARDSKTRDTFLNTPTSYWGCAGLKGSMVTLLPGEWILITGTASISKSLLADCTIHAAWSMDSLSYSVGGDHLVLHSVTSSYVTSVEKKVE